MYATLQALKQRLSIAVTTDDALLLKFLQRASASIHEYTGREFVPRYSTRSYHAPGQRVLFLQDDLLELVNLADTNTRPSTEYDLITDRLPHYGLRLKNSAPWWQYTDPTYAVSVTGWWGYHQHEYEMWQSLSVLSADATASAATLAVPTPSLFEVGQYLRIDDELMQVNTINVADISVSRGVRGTSASEHSAAATICAWHVLSDVEECALALAQFMYSNRDKGGLMNIGAPDASVTVSYNSPASILKTVMGYRAVRILGV